MLLPSKNYCIKLLKNEDSSDKPFFQILFALMLYNSKAKFPLSPSVCVSLSHKHTHKHTFTHIFIFYFWILYALPELPMRVDYV